MLRGATMQRSEVNILPVWGDRPRKSCQYTEVNGAVSAASPARCLHSEMIGRARVPGNHDTKEYR